MSKVGAGIVVSQSEKEGCPVRVQICQPFRCALKAENTRGEALLFSWSHLHGIYSLCRDIPPSDWQNLKFADQHLLTQSVSDRVRVLLYSGKICALSAARFVHNRQILPANSAFASLQIKSQVEICEF